MLRQLFKGFIYTSFERVKDNDIVLLQPLLHLINSEQSPVIAWFYNLRNLCITLSLLPLLWLFMDILFNNLGSNPIQALHIRLGDWGLRFLCISLLITPIQKITKWRGMAHYRQLFGLYAFFYASLHVLGYLAADQAFVWPIIVTDIAESPYIWFGLFAYIILLLLALTSPDAAKKLLGKNWKKLHRWIYPAVVAVLLHYFWQLKGNLAEPLFYALVVFVLLAFRVLLWYKNRQFSRLMIPTSRSAEND
jgi:methionine sulfoxide reductase heme-binding subunit